MPLSEEQQAEVQAEVQRIAGGIRDEARAQGARDREAEITSYLAGEAESQRIAALQGEEQLRAQVTAADTARQQAEQRAAAIEQRAAARTALHAANFDPATIEDALVLLGDGDLAETVPALATRLPALLLTTDGATPPGAPPAPKPPAKPAAPGSGTPSAAERAKARFEATQTPLAKTA